MPNLILLFGLLFFLWIGTESYVNEPNCGLVQPKAHGRVFGGKLVPQGKYPFMVAVVFPKNDTKKGSSFCAGAILTQKWIITAAHCLHGTPKVKVGHVNRSLAQTVEAEGYFPYPDFRRHEGHHPDIGLLKLRHPLAYGKDVASICLNTELRSYEYSKAVSMGWGKRGPNGKTSKQLIELKVTVLYKNECQQRYKYQYEKCESENDWDSAACKRVKQKFINATLPGLRYGLICSVPRDTETQSMCKGDSGGPLVVKNDNRFYTIGVFYTAFCGSSEMLARYAKISDYFDWIDETMSENS